MPKWVELVLITKQETIILPRTKPTVAKGLLVAIRIRYSEPKFNQQNESIVRKVPRDWNKGIHNVNRIPRRNPPCCTYYHQIGHQINECPFIKDNVRQGFAKHFQNLNPKPTKAKDHGVFELKDLYHEGVIIPNKLREQIWKNNKVEMRAQIMADLAPIFIIPAPNMFHHNNVGGTYARTSNFKVEPIRFVPLYYVAMPHSMVTVTKVPFTTTPAHIIVVMKSKP